ncbi:MAG: cadherin-like domain-containing protein [Gammaproteobacteria bacterium]|nr:cadherin-like domain-containing protein [Gammaproteobacteria bacterium]
MNLRLRPILSALALAISSTSLLATPNQTIQGTVSIDFEDHMHSKQNAKSQKRYWLTSADGTSELLMPQAPNWLKAGQKISIQAQKTNGKWALVDNQINLLQTNEQVASAELAAATGAMVSGINRVLIAEVNFAINPIVRYSSGQLSQMMEQSNQFFNENSYGEFGLVSDALEAITVDVDTSVCDTSALANQADTIFRQRGYEPNDYDHVVYVMPTHPKCSWSGKGNVNGPRSWIKRFELSTINHELGHNLGLYHSNKKECGSVTTNSDACSVVEYGDYNSAMSSTASTKHINAAHKEQLGWLANKVANISSSQTVTLSPYELNDSSTKAVKIRKGLNSNGQLEYYYLEYRQAIGFDSSLGNEFPSFLNGVRLREAIEGNVNSSNLLDPTPNSNSYDWDDISLSPGMSYQDQAYGINISVLSSDTSQLTLQVSYEQTNTCQINASSLTRLSAQNVNAQTGEQLLLEYQLTNNDDSNCTATNYQLSQSLHNGFNGSLDINQVTLAPKQSQLIRQTINVGTSTDAATYSLGINANRENDSAAAYYQVTVLASNSNNAPNANNDSLVLTQKSSASIQVLNNDSDPEGDSIYVVSTTQGSKGSVSINADGSLKYTPSKRFKSSDSFSYTISDGQLTSSATVSVSLQATSDGGSDGGSGGKGGGKGRK